MFLNDISLFIQTAKFNSFNDAAKNLGLSTATISRKINRLEEKFGIKLFYRNNDGMKLTQAGRNLQKSCTPAIFHIENAIEVFDKENNDEKGSIKFLGPINFIRQAFSSKLFTHFFQQYPDIIINFELSNDRVNLNTSEFDIAIRMGELEDSRFICKTVTKIEFVLVASPSLFVHHQPPQNLQQLSQLKHIVFSPTPYWHFNSPEGEAIKYQPKEEYLANDLDICIARAVSGIGAALLPKCYIEKELIQGKLITLLPHYQCQNSPLQLLWPNRLLHRRTRLFIDHIADTLASEPCLSAYFLQQNYPEKSSDGESIILKL